MKQRLWPVNHFLIYNTHSQAHFFFPHSFWFGLMAAWIEENTFTRRTSSIPQGFSFKNLNVKNDFSNNKQSIKWTWPKQKVWFFSSPTPQQLKVRKFAGSLFHGNISDVPHVWTHPRHTDIQGTGTRGQRAGRYKTGPNPRGAQGMALTVPRCWFVTWHGPPFVPLGHIFVCSVLSPPHFPTGEKAIPLPSFQHHLWLEGWSETVSQPVTQPCWQGLPAHTRPTGGPESPGERATLPGEVHCVIPHRWLLLIVKALWQRTKLCESTPCVRCFFGISTCGEFLCKICYSEAPTVSFKKLFYRIGVNL